YSGVIKHLSDWPIGRNGEHFARAGYFDLERRVATGVNLGGRKVLEMDALGWPPGLFGGIDDEINITSGTANIKVGIGLGVGQQWLQVELLTVVAVVEVEMHFVGE